MTKFETQIEQMEQRRQEERNRAINEELLWSLRTRTREEVIEDMVRLLSKNQIGANIK